MTHRVVVTGWGVVSSIGQTAAAYWSNLSRGVCGIADATIIPTDDLAQKVVAEVKDFDPRKYLKPAMEAKTKLCKQRLQEFNTAGQASKIKKVLTTVEMAKRYSKGELDPRVG